MQKYLEKIQKACEILGLGEQASLKKIKNNYYKLCQKWHPDKQKQSSPEADEMIKKINEAHQTIMNYCENFEYSFKKEDVKKYIPYDEMWTQQFGSDPHWGGEE